MSEPLHHRPSAPSALLSYSDAKTLLLIAGGAAVRRPGPQESTRPTRRMPQWVLTFVVTAFPNEL